MLKRIITNSIYLPLAQVRKEYPNFSQLQIIGTAGEKLVSELVICCNHDLEDMNHIHINYPGVDHMCKKCRTGFQVKTSSKPARVEGNYVYIPMSKTFEKSLLSYDSIRYIFVEYRITTKKVLGISITHPLTKYNIYNSSTLKCTLDQSSFQLGDLNTPRPKIR